jgi:hypothetical protein
MAVLQLHMEDDAMLSRVKLLWSYAPLSGEFRWNALPVEEFQSSKNMTSWRNQKKWNSTFAGELAGTAKPDRHKFLSRGGLVFRAESAAIARTIDAFPRGTVRVIDRAPSNVMRANLTFTEGVWSR